MKVTFFARNSRYRGTIHVPSQRSSGGVLADVRLQEIINNPAVLHETGEMTAQQIILHDADVSFRAQGECYTISRPRLLLNPRFIEVAYEPSVSRGDSASAPGYEKRQKGQTDRVELLMRGRTLVIGQVYRGLRAVAYEGLERKIFAMTDVMLEIYDPVRMTEKTDYVLVNRDYVESFRSLPESE